MKNPKLSLLILALFLVLTPLFAQQYATGAILDTEKYNQTDAKPVLHTRNYTNLPRSVSLKQFSPIPESQGNYGTCVGWSTAFAARTISESAALNRTNRTETSGSVFSPAFVYKNISDNAGQNGAVISDALEFMKKVGAVKRQPGEKEMRFENIPLTLFNIPQRYTISGYVRLFINSKGEPGTIQERVLPVKKSLSEGKPVIIGMNTPPSFHSAKEIWRPTENPNNTYGGHAMCVVGYDDNKDGGAFEIQNSWGTDWGNGGYVWIRYSDFAHWVYHAYEVIENLANYKAATRYAATIEIEVDTPGTLFKVSDMPVTFDRTGYYKTRSSWPSGTEFRFLLTSKEPAYVYAFAADTTNPGTERIFPLPGTSPVLDYTDSTIAWPGENEWIRMDEVTGTDYLIVLFSKQELDIEAIEQRFAAQRGSFPERVARAVGSNFIPYNRATYENDKIAFNAQSTDPKAIFGLLLAIDHR